MEFGLSGEVIDKIRSVFSRHADIESAIVYGSRAMGTYRPGSDLDICLHGNLNAKQLLALHCELEELDLPYQIDLSIYSTINNPDLRQHIDRVGKSLYP
ncbi:nucleotidyltransferase domain-containing protein [Bowmanella dokdonensis]|uniref:Nucleotidyltransferase domain-containing protein n=1 Tax=Bowmanella dokdonensis TaxID=751969 RepID=A0A939DN83_9ALTE|nr:nucleotidyltransferase domain-containing protein [Bowmanella dokdonensis]MBN7825757.1 nucleotidyltransferase domain-containing protein [Bowmanella dokdonensis]